jgi:hypothetical protein
VTAAFSVLLLVPAAVLAASGSDAAQDGGFTTAALLAVAVGVAVAAFAAGPVSRRHDARTDRRR